MKFKKIISGLSIIGSVWLLAMSCGGGGGDATPNLTGTVDFDANPSKVSRRFASNITASVTNADTNATYSVTLSDTTYAATIPFSVNVRVKILSNGKVVLARFLTSEETSTGSVQADVDIVTTMQEKIITQFIAQRKSVSEALKEANMILFGAEEVTVTEMTVAKIAENDAELAGEILILGVLANSISTGESTAAESLFEKLVGSFEEGESLAEIKSEFITATNALTDSDELSAFGSAFQGATNEGVVAQSVFETTIKSQLSEAVTAAVEAAEEVPTFNTDVDSVRTAAPGVLFKYDFPEASTVDILGIDGYETSWSATPAGPVDTSANSGRTVEFIPSKADEGSTFTYTVTANGKNGKSVSQSITIDVKPLTLTGLSIRSLAGDSSDVDYQPRVGVEVYGDYAYVVSWFSDTSANIGYRLERYATSSLSQDSGQSITPDKKWTLPDATGGPVDLKIGPNRAYVATNMSGVLAWDLNLESTTPDFTLAAAATPVTQLALVGSSVYAYKGSTAEVVKTDADLGNAATDTGATTLAQSMFPYDFGTTGSTYLYFGNFTEVKFYDVLQSAALADSYSAASSSYALDDVNEIELGVNSINPPSGAMSSVTQIKPSGSSVMTSAINVDYNLSHLRGNATYLYGVNSSASTVAGSLTGSSETITDTASSLDLVYTNTYSTIQSGINNVPTGITSGRSGTYVYTVGQSVPLTSMMTGTWFIKTHKAEPNQ